MKVKARKMKLGVVVSVILLFGLFLVVGACAQGGGGGWGTGATVGVGGSSGFGGLGTGSTSSGTSSAGGGISAPGFNSSEMGNQPGTSYNPDAEGSMGFGRNYNYQPGMPGNAPAE